MADIPSDSDTAVDGLCADKAAEDAAFTRQEQLQMLEDLKLEHRRIDTEIAALVDMGAVDMLKIGRMKKIKLSIKDQISYLENQLTPDIIA